MTTLAATTATTFTTTTTLQNCPGPVDDPSSPGWKRQHDCVIDSLNPGVYVDDSYVVNIRTCAMGCEIAAKGLSGCCHFVPMPVKNVCKFYVGVTSLPNGGRPVRTTTPPVNVAFPGAGERYAQIGLGGNFCDEISKPEESKSWR
jgi:hypothetical protein